MAPLWRVSCASSPAPSLHGLLSLMPSHHPERLLYPWPAPTMEGFVSPMPCQHPGYHVHLLCQSMKGNLYFLYFPFNRVSIVIPLCPFLGSTVPSAKPHYGGSPVSPALPPPGRVSCLPGLPIPVSPVQLSCPSMKGVLSFLFFPLHGAFFLPLFGFLLGSPVPLQLPHL